MSLAELEATGAVPALDAPVIEMDSVDKEFILGGAFVGQTILKALSGVSLKLVRKRALALVGESGSGKSTVARMIARAYTPTRGHINFNGEDIAHLRGARLQQYRSEVQMVFQDPFGSLNPTQSIAYHIERPLRLHRPELRGKAVQQELLALLEGVGLTPAADYAKRRPHELSGGQRQRVAIARALSVHPEVLLADEPTSMLDVSVRLGILNLLEDLKQQRNLAALYITHDIASARYFADDTMVMYAGRIVEGGDSETVTQRPAHPYTQLLIASAPDPDGMLGAGARGLDAVGEPPSLIDPPSGCRFHPRCPRVMPRCSAEAPPRLDIPDAPGHWAACWLYGPDPS